MTLEKPVKIIKTFDLDSVKEITQGDELPRIQLSGYASRGFLDNGMRAVDLDGETINQYGIDVSRLQTGNIPLLFQHDQSKIVGKVLTASYDSKGLYVTAELTKLPGDSLTNYVYQAVKAKLLNSFSVGLMVEEIDWLDNADSSMLEISKSHLFELSIVSTPALASAVFTSTVIKSADGYAQKAVIASKELQKDNENLCSDLGCLLKAAKKDKAVEKTIVEKDVTPEEVVEETPEVVVEETPEETVEDAPTVVEEVTETPIPEVVEETTTEADPEPKEEEAPLKTSENNEDETQNMETPNIVEEVTPTSAEVSMTLEDALDLLSGIKIEDLSTESLEELFETVSTLTEAVEKKVVEEIAATLLAEQSEGEEA